VHLLLGDTLVCLLLDAVQGPRLPLVEPARRGFAGDLRHLVAYVLFLICYLLNICTVASGNARSGVLQEA